MAALPFPANDYAANKAYLKVLFRNATLWCRLFVFRLKPIVRFCDKAIHGYLQREYYYRRFGKCTG